MKCRIDHERKNYQKNHFVNFSISIEKIDESFTKFFAHFIKYFRRDEKFEFVFDAIFNLKKKFDLSRSTKIENEHRKFFDDVDITFYFFAIRFISFDDLFRNLNQQFEHEIDENVNVFQKNIELIFEKKKKILINQFAILSQIRTFDVNDET